MKRPLKKFFRPFIFSIRRFVKLPLRPMKTGAKTAFRKEKKQKFVLHLTYIIWYKTNFMASSLPCNQKNDAKQAFSEKNVIALQSEITLKSNNNDRKTSNIEG